MQGQREAIARAQLLLSSLASSSQSLLEQSERSLGEVGVIDGLVLVAVLSYWWYAQEWV